MIDFKALAAPFEPSEISWRVGSVTKDKLKGMALAYLDARAVADRLDAVCGPDGWQCRYSHAAQKTVCDIGIRVQTEAATANAVYQTYEWLWKADGAGDSDIEAEKGALSDAFKRAAVRWGIGRYLYDLQSPWVELDEWKRIKDSEKTKLNNILIAKTRSLTNPTPADRIINNAAKPMDGGSTDPDVLAGAKDWVEGSEANLSVYATESDVLAWNRKYAKALVKLQGTSEDLYDRIMLAYGAALTRTRREAA